LPYKDYGCKAWRDLRDRRTVLDLVWCLLVALSIAFYMNNISRQRMCAEMGVDFRGYYASAQIALERGFAQVYDSRQQQEYLSILYHRCPAGTVQDIPIVAMPYLPAYVLLMLPFTALEFTTSYFVWTALNLVLLTAYLLRFVHAFGMRPSALHLLQWVFCLPVLSNLYLGQMNILLVIFLGEFVLAFFRGRQRISGSWLGLMMIKPHLLILLLPGMALSRNWRVLQGFFISGLAVLGISTLLAGPDGIVASAALAVKFAGPLIQTAATMMNWRALALNLNAVFPGWLAWGVALTGIALTTALVIYLWLRVSGGSPERWVLLILATYAGTIAVTWHAHFYLLMPLIPLLMVLDGKRLLPVSVLAAWLLGPPLIFLAVYLTTPDLARNGFGLGMLALDVTLLIWAAVSLVKEGE